MIGTKKLPRVRGECVEESFEKRLQKRRYTYLRERLHVMLWSIYSFYASHMIRMSIFLFPVEPSGFVYQHVCRPTVGSFEAAEHQQVGDALGRRLSKIRLMAPSCMAGETNDSMQLRKFSTKMRRTNISNMCARFWNPSEMSVGNREAQTERYTRIDGRWFQDMMTKVRDVADLLDASHIRCLWRMDHRYGVCAQVMGLSWFFPNLPSAVRVSSEMCETLDVKRS
jgi:hypothetical protein